MMILKNWKKLNTLYVLKFQVQLKNLKADPYYDIIDEKIVAQLITKSIKGVIQTFRQGVSSKDVIKVTRFSDIVKDKNDKKELIRASLQNKFLNPNIKNILNLLFEHKIMFEEKENSNYDNKSKNNFFIVPMPGLNYDDDDDETKKS